MFLEEEPDSPRFHRIVDALMCDGNGGALEIYQIKF